MPRRVHTTKRGFTLIEMLISMALFTVVITMTVGTLLVLIDANGRAQSMQLVVTNLTFALDSMTREIRTGFNWYCKDASVNGYSIPAGAGLQDCDGGSSGDFISIVESGDNVTERLAVCNPDPSGCSHRISYWFDEDFYGSSPNHGAIVRRLGDDTEGGAVVALTGPDIWIDEMKLVVSGTLRQQLSGDTEQPVASLYIRGRAGVSDTTLSAAREQEFDIQTTITQRLMDI